MAQETLKAETSTEGHLSSGESKSSEIKTAPGGHQRRSTRIDGDGDVRHVKRKDQGRLIGKETSSDKEIMNRLHKYTLDYICIIDANETCFHKRWVWWRSPAPHSTAPGPFQVLDPWQRSWGCAPRFPRLAVPPEANAMGNPNCFVLVWWFMVRFLDQFQCSHSWCNWCKIFWWKRGQSHTIHIQF